MELFSQPILNSIKLPVHVKGNESKLIENNPASAANSELVCLVIINCDVYWPHELFKQAFNFLLLNSFCVFKNYFYLTQSILYNSINISQVKFPHLAF